MTDQIQTQDLQNQNDVIPTLYSADRQSSFSFNLLKWESLFPCTQYDEWLISELKVTAPHTVLEITLHPEHATEQKPFVHQGPFILRFEVEALVENLQKIQSGELTEYVSDHIEPLLQLKLLRDESGIQFSGMWAKNPLFQWSLDLKSIPVFCEQTIARLSELQDQL